MKQRLQTLLVGQHPQLLGLSILLLRCTVGIILFVIGAGKVFGWWGGKGLDLTIQSFVTQMGVPAVLAYLSCFTEMVGGLFLLIGFLTRPAALAVSVNMLVATYFMLPRGFFMGGAAYPFSLLAISVVILLVGPMNYSVDSLLSLNTKPLAKMGLETTS